MTLQLLLASNNPKKRREFEALLGPLGIELLCPVDVGGLDDVDEDQPDFAGNALKKSRAASSQKHLLALADDSGLEVDALDGAPGVRSARFAGEPSNDERNNDLLLERLGELPAEKRGARFVCALALTEPSGRALIQVEGYARGRILKERRGTRDFGYDPLFEFCETGHAQRGRSFAELTPEQKAEVSHRGRAVKKFLTQLQELLPSLQASKR